MRDYKGELINMIDHISVASDANINYLMRVTLLRQCFI